MVTGQKRYFSRNPVHTYQTAGNYTVSLTVINVGGSDIETKTNFIRVSAPASKTPVLSQIPDQTTTVGTLLTFTISGWDPDSDNLSFSAPVLPGGATFVPSTRTFSWTPSDGQEGNYLVTFTVSDGAFTDSESCKIIVISKTKTPPIAQFTTNITQGHAPLTVQFTDQSVSPGRSYFAWDINNDNSTDYTTRNPVHTYTTAGNYSVNLTMTNADGSDSEIKKDYIQVIKINHAPVLFPLRNQTVNVTQKLSFNISSSDPDGDNLSCSADRLPTGSTFNTTSGVFAWTPQDSQEGNYSVNFTVSDGVLSDSKIAKIVVLPKLKSPPTAQFTANTTQGQAPLTVQFTDQSVSAGTISYVWDINNDGKTDYTTRNPFHTYQTAGNYSVNLKVTNADGNDSEIKIQYIQVVKVNHPPVLYPVSNQMATIAQKTLFYPRVIGP